MFAETKCNERWMILKSMTTAKEVFFIQQKSKDGHSPAVHILHKDIIEISEKVLCK